MISSRNIIREVRIKAHLCPFLFSGIISCFAIRLVSHSWRVESRLVTHRLSWEGSSRAGKVIAIRIRGIPRREGLENWSKKLRFMVRFKGMWLKLLVFCWMEGWLIGTLGFWVGLVGRMSVKKGA